MAFSQLDWLALFLFGIVVGWPFIIEYIRMIWIILPDDFSKLKSARRLKWYERMVWSKEWYERIREHAGPYYPRLWMLPLSWVVVWFLGTAAVWFVWSNQSNYSQVSWDAFFGLQMVIAILSTVWHVLFLRSEDFVRSTIPAIVIACVAISSLVIALVGSFSGDSTTPDGFLYIVYAMYWVWMAILAITALKIEKKYGISSAMSESAFVPHAGARFVPAHDSVHFERGGSQKR